MAKIQSRQKSSVSLLAGLWAALGALGLSAACSEDEVKPKSLAEDRAEIPRNPPGMPVAETPPPENPGGGKEEPPDPEDPHSGLNPGDKGTVTLYAKLDAVTPATEQEVVAWFQAECQACHQSGAGYASFWSINFAGLNKSLIRSDSDAHKVFQTIVNAVEGYEKPSPMPKDNAPDPDTDRFNSFLQVIKWYLNETPEVAVNAYLEYQLVNPFGKDVDVVYDFTCPKPVKFRTYLGRLTFDAFGRFPTEQDFAIFEESGGYGKEDVVTAEMRRSVAREVFSRREWRQEFLDYGLHNFARKLSGASELSASTSDSAVPAGDDHLLKSGLTPSEAEDLKDEFYQLLLRNIDLPYVDLLLGNVVPVTLNTKDLYGCSIRTLGGDSWDDCDISAQNPLRKSYFTSFSFLASKQTSFLSDNNNYGRIAALYFFIRGQALKAATDGPRGATVNELPGCLKSKDTRGHEVGDTFGPFGTVQIPHSGNVCQVCHIGSNLANGSILFRPFGNWGQSFFKEDFESRADVNSLPGVEEALQAKRRSINSPRDESQTFPVDTAFLASLLPDSEGQFTDEQACMTGDGTEVVVDSVQEMARLLIGDGSELARGMARHIPRGISNINRTNSELIQEIETAFLNEGGRVLPLFEAYFASETFACGNEGAE